MFPKGPWVKDSIPWPWHSKEGAELVGGGATGEEVDYWTDGLDRVRNAGYFFFLILGIHEVTRSLKDVYQIHILTVMYRAA